MVFQEFGRFGFDPFVELRRVQNEMNRLLTGYTAAATQEFPPLNLWLSENSVVVTAELPGVSRDDITLSVQQDMLTLQGQRQRKADDEGARWQRRERLYGSFSRTVRLPFAVDPGKVQTRFDNGVLEIELQRPEADRPRKIEVRAGS